MNNSNAGKTATFHNLYAYPSLHGKMCHIVSDHGPGYHYRYGITFPHLKDSKSMAATEREVTISKD